MLPSLCRCFRVAAISYGCIGRSNSSAKTASKHSSGGDHAQVIKMYLSMHPYMSYLKIYLNSNLGDKSMFGRHFGSPFEGKWAARQGWRGHFGPGGGHRGRHGGGGDFMRARRMLAQGDLRLIALA